MTRPRSVLLTESRIAALRALITPTRNVGVRGLMITWCASTGRTVIRALSDWPLLEPTM